MGTVTGTVTYQGKPVVKAAVSFIPLEKGTLAAVGVTDGSGKYVLRSSGESEGAIVGTYQVTIILRAPYDGPVPEGVSEAMAQDLYQSQGKPLIPEKYFTTQTSGLTKEVLLGRNTFDFKIEE